MDDGADQDHPSASEKEVDEKKGYLYPNPPAYGYPEDGERPPFILIEPYAYYANRHNATTASCDMRDLGGTLRVTFCVAHPPLVSYLCVHATAFDHTDFAVEPHIIAIETNGGGLVLLRVVTGKSPSAVMVQSQQEYFIYDASVPSLEHLPHPRSHQFNDHSIAIVRNCNSNADHEDHDCSSCDYVIATQSRGFAYAESPALILYHSDTKTWSRVPMVIKSYPSHRTSKTLTIGGTVVWADLWRNILLCDVLEKRPTLRTLELPPPMELTNSLGSPLSVRDIAVLGGSIMYVELYYRRVEQQQQQGFLGDTSSPILYTWKVAGWSISTGSSSSEDWHMDYLLNSTEIPGSSLRKLRVDEGSAQPTLSTLHIGLPNLSLQDDGIVYFLAKIDYRDINGISWVLAVDMRNKTVQKVGEFNSMRTAAFEKGYSASRISKYLKRA